MVLWQVGVKYGKHDAVREFIGILFGNPVHVPMTRSRSSPVKKVDNIGGSLTKSCSRRKPDLKPTSLGTLNFCKPSRNPAKTKIWRIRNYYFWTHGGHFPRRVWSGAEVAKRFGLIWRNPPKVFEYLCKQIYSLKSIVRLGKWLHGRSHSPWGWRKIVVASDCRTIVFLKPVGETAIRC